MYNIHIFPLGRGAVLGMMSSTGGRVRTIYLILLLASVCLTFQSVFAKRGTGDPLWQESVTIAAANKHWVPESAILRIEILDRHGKVEQAEEMLLDFTQEDNGQIPANSHIDLPDPISLNIVGNSPFEPEFQDEISAHPTGENRNILGKQCVKYEYIWDRQDEVLTGAAWLEQERGIPVEIEFSSGACTQFSRRQHVTVIFQGGSCDAWFPLRMTMEIRGGLLTLGRSFRITVDYKAYRKTE